MKLSLSCILYLSLLLGATPTLLAQTTQQETALTNAAVVRLAQAGFKEKTIISIINARIPRFDLAPDRMIELKRSGVTEKIIIAMLARQEGLDADVAYWNDDVTLNTGTDSRGNSTGNAKPQTGSTDIFGSSGGVKGKSRSRGATTGSVDEDTETTGSTSVRIIRPTSEAGAPAKLEKATPLTNDSIAELVEAGFSEGTIIRRIEKSPVEFDLTPAKLDELHRRRVSDKILTAMKAAMGDEATK